MIKLKFTHFSGLNFDISQLPRFHANEKQLIVPTALLFRKIPKLSKMPKTEGTWTILK